MSLLDDLRSGAAPSSSREQWSVLPGLLVAAVPEYQHVKIVLVRGEVIILGVFRTSTLPRHCYAVLHSERTAADPAGSKDFPHASLLDPAVRPGRRRPAAMGISRYRAESETNYYTDPWVGWVDPTPEGFASWITGIVLGTKHDTPQLEQMKNARR